MVNDTMKSTFVSKTDLAIAYFPHMEARSARGKLMSLITSAGTLLERLRSSGYTDRQKDLSPHQVEMIMEQFGNPFH